MEIPSGMELSDGKCLILQKKIYGLLQSTRGFMDACLWVKQSNSGMIKMTIFVYDYHTLLDLMKVSWE
jgi:hypothetical protein